MAFYFIPYLNFDGTANAAFTQYQRVFNGKITIKQTFGATEFGKSMPLEEQEKIMHIALEIAPGYTLMASDILASNGQQLQKGNNHYISLNASSETEAHNWYQQLSEDGIIEMELQKTDWGALFAIFTDRFGIQWMINYDYE
jgi:PhnB protein